MTKRQAMTKSTNNDHNKIIDQKTNNDEKEKQRPKDKE